MFLKDSLRQECIGLEWQPAKREKRAWLTAQPLLKGNSRREIGRGRRKIGRGRKRRGGKRKEGEEEDRRGEIEGKEGKMKAKKERVQKNRYNDKNEQC